MKFVGLTVSLCAALFSSRRGAAGCAEAFQYQALTIERGYLPPTERSVRLFETQEFCFGDKASPGQFGWHKGDIGQVAVEDCSNEDLAVCVSSFFVFALPLERPKVGDTWTGEGKTFQKFWTSTLSVFGQEYEVDVINSIDSEGVPFLRFYVNPERGLLAFSGFPDDGDLPDPLRVLVGPLGIGHRPSENKTEPAR